MKAHELAKLLLASPDLPVVIAWDEHGDLVEVREVNLVGGWDDSTGMASGEALELED